MNTPATETNGTGRGNWIAFLFGAAFNIFAHSNLTFLTDYFLQAVAGGFVVLIFKIIADIFGPLWLRYRERISRIARRKKPHKAKRRNRHGQH